MEGNNKLYPSFGFVAFSFLCTISSSQSFFCLKQISLWLTGRV